MESSEVGAAIGAAGKAASEVSRTVERMQRVRLRSARRWLSGSSTATGVVDAVGMHTAAVHRTIQLTAEGTGAVAGAISRLPWADSPTALHETPRGASAIAALGAAFGDRLSADPSTETLAPGMSIRHAGRSVSVPDFVDQHSATASIGVMVHGLGCTELNWSPAAVDEVRDRGFTPVMIRYNTGLAISDNAASFAALLDELVEQWPTDLHRVALIGHSMGGLVARSGIAGVAPLTADAVSDLITIGSPHGGSPIEKAAQLGLSAMGSFESAEPLARLGDKRSIGIKDLRHGIVRDQDDPTGLPALPTGITHTAVVGAWPEDSTGWWARLIGDGAVRQDSASHAGPPGPDVGPIIVPGTSHLALMGAPVVALALDRATAHRASPPAPE